MTTKPYKVSIPEGKVLCKTEVVGSTVNLFFRDRLRIQISGKPWVETDKITGMYGSIETKELFYIPVPVFMDDIVPMRLEEVTKEETAIEECIDRVCTLHKIVSYWQYYIPEEVQGHLKRELNALLKRLSPNKVPELELPTPRPWCRDQDTGEGQAILNIIDKEAKDELLSIVENLDKVTWSVSDFLQGLRLSKEATIALNSLYCLVDELKLLVTKAAK